MPDKSYIVKVSSGSPDVDLDASMRATASWMMDFIEPGGNYELIVDVTDGEGNLIAGHLYQPEPEDA